jgi:hypothetical protein
MTPDTTLPVVEGFSLSGILTWVWLLMVCIFILHWVVASYHWYTFGSEKSLSYLSILVYGGGGLLILVSMGLLLLAM